MSDPRTIADRLWALGYIYESGLLDRNDGRRAIYSIGMDGYAIDYFNAKEAADFCKRHEDFKNGKK